MSMLQGYILINVVAFGALVLIAFVAYLIAGDGSEN